jgi:hypothetical protein
VLAVDPVTALSLIRGGKTPDRVGERRGAAYRAKAPGIGKRRR